MGGNKHYILEKGSVKTTNKSGSGMNDQSKIANTREKRKNMDVKVLGKAEDIRKKRKDTSITEE